MSRAQRGTQLVELMYWCTQQVRGAKASPTKLPVELRQDIPGLGEVGQLAKVNHGYARNFLIPRKLAAIRRGKQSGSVAGWSESVQDSTAERPRQTMAARDEEELKRQQAALQRRRLESVIKKITTVPVHVRRKAKESGHLDQPVTAEDIVDAVQRQLQVVMVPQLVDLGGDVLRAVGEYRLPLKLMLPEGQRAMLDVNIVAT